MSDTLTTASTVTPNPIPLADAKRHLNVSTTYDDTLIGDLISAAGSYTEARCGRAWLRQLRSMKMDGFDDKRYVYSREIRPPVSPLTCVESITYVDSNGTTQTLSTTAYRVDTGTRPGRITEEYDNTWPDTYGVANDVTISYYAGFGTSSNSTYTHVPANVRHAVRMLVGHWYRNREAILQGTISKEIELGLGALLESEEGPTYG